MGMKPGIWNIEYAAGTQLDETFRWVENDVPVNTALYAGTMQIRKQYSDSELYLQLTTANGRIVMNGTLGTIRLYASPAVMNAVPVGVFRYDLVLSTGAPFRFMQGTFTVTPAVTVL